MAVDPAVRAAGHGELSRRTETLETRVAAQRVHSFIQDHVMLALVKKRQKNIVFLDCSITFAISKDNYTKEVASFKYLLTSYEQI